MKQVTVFGANGKVGSLVVTQLLERGYSVVAFVHRPETKTSHKNLVTFQGDIYDSDQVARALNGSNAVISALGSWGTPKKDILETGMIHAIGAMQRAGIKRIITLTGSEARIDGDDISLVHQFAHFMAGLLAGKILRDGERHIALLQHSGLEWTSVRSPVMNENGTAEFKLGFKRPLPWQTIHRHAVATAMVNMLDDETFARKSPYITR